MSNEHYHNHHHHDHNHGAHGKSLVISIILNVGITVAQIIGGLISGSVALLSDAAHNFSDVLALLFSYIARRLSGRNRTLKQTFGYKRAGIFAAFINSATLMIVATFLVHEAIDRLIHPKPIEGVIVIWLAALGIILNGISALLVKNGAKNDLNMRSAYIHLFTDMLTSIGVLFGGFAITYLDWFWVDGLLTIVIAIYLIYSSWAIFYDSLRIFMQFTPTEINIEEIAVRMAAIEGVKNIHHVHVWNLDDHEMMFEAHLDLQSDFTISHFESILEKVDEVLDQYNIHHFNIQPEYARNDEKSLINNQDH